MSKKLYLIKQEYNCDYDTYDSAVVCAKSEHDASMVHPEEGHSWSENAWAGPSSGTLFDGSWVDPQYVEVTFIGEAKKDMAYGVVLSSYNAG